MKRVLFVDDEPNVLAALRRSLASQRDRWDMHFAASAAAALELMTRIHVDVIVADFRMPDIDGAQLLAAVRRRWPETGRLMLSGHTERDDLIAVMSVAQAFLDKPCERDVLIAAVERSLRREALTGRLARAEIGSLELLPATCRAIDELHAALDRGEVTERRVAQIVGGDIGLTVKVLQLANSSFFGGAGDVLSVPDAVNRVGLATVRSITLLRGLAAPVDDSGVLPADWLTRLNENAGAAARVAAQLSSPEHADEAFCAALLQECGQLVFAACWPDALGGFLAEVAVKTPVDAAALEAAEFGASHAHAGAYLLSLWGLPPQVVDAVATHDQPAGPTPSGPLAVSDATRAARLIAARTTGTVCLTAPKDQHRQLHTLGAPSDRRLSYDDLGLEMQP